MRGLEFTRTPLETWAWAADGEVVGGTAHQNPKAAMEAGLELVEASLRDGDMELADARTLVDGARRAVVDVDDPGEAHRAAAALARDFLDGLGDEEG
jgi:hypothetical protein